MERAIDVVIDIHTQAEINRLKEDIRQKCEQIVKLYGDHVIYEDPRFFYVIGFRRKKLIE